MKIKQINEEHVHKIIHTNQDDNHLIKKLYAPDQNSCLSYCVPKF